MAKVLVVEDNEALRELFLAVLSTAGYELHTALDGQEAMKWLGQEKFDVLISDVTMPQMSGLELFMRVKELDAELAAHTILITGVSDARTCAFIERNKIPYLLKPFQVKRLLELLERLVHGRSESSKAAGSAIPGKN